MYVGGDVSQCKDNGCAVPSVGARARLKNCGGGGCLYDVLNDPTEEAPLCTAGSCRARTLRGVTTTKSEATRLLASLKARVAAMAVYAIFSVADGGSNAANAALDALDDAYNDADICGDEEHDYQRYAYEHPSAGYGVLQPLDGLVGSLPAPPPVPPPVPSPPPLGLPPPPAGQTCAVSDADEADVDVDVDHAAWCAQCSLCSGYCPRCYDER